MRRGRERRRPKEFRYARRRRGAITRNKRWQGKGGQNHRRTRRRFGTVDVPLTRDKLTAFLCPFSLAERILTRVREVRGDTITFWTDPSSIARRPARRGEGVRLYRQGKRSARSTGRIGYRLRGDCMCKSHWGHRSCHNLYRLCRRGRLRRSRVSRSRSRGSLLRALRHKSRTCDVCAAGTGPSPDAMITVTLVTIRKVYIVTKCTNPVTWVGCPPLWRVVLTCKAYTRSSFFCSFMIYISHVKRSGNGNMWAPCIL